MARDMIVSGDKGDIRAHLRPAGGSSGGGHRNWFQHGSRRALERQARDVLFRSG